MGQLSKKEIFHAALRGGFFPQYSSDGAFESAKGSSGAEADRYWNTASKIVREHNGTVWRDQSASSGLPTVEHFTGSDTLAANETGKVCTNKGATTSIVLTLPVGASAGTSFAFAIIADKKITVSVQEGEKIWHGEGSYKYGSNFYTDVIGCVISVFKIDSDGWVIYRHFDTNPSGISDWVSESKTIVTKNVIPNLSQSPYDDEAVELYLGNAPQQNDVDFSVVGTEIAWNTPDGLDIEVGDDVWCRFPIGAIGGGWTFMGYTGYFGFFGGGGPNTWDGVNIIEYIDPDIFVGNSTDRGDLITPRNGPCGIKGPVYGFFCGGRHSNTPMNVIDYIDRTATTGNAVDRGDLSQSRSQGGGVQGEVYGFIGGGRSSNSNIIDYIILANTTGNALDKGDMVTAALGMAGVSKIWASSSYGFFAGIDAIGYINTESTTGNAVDRGDLSVSRQLTAGLSGSVLGVFGGGSTGGGEFNIIDYIYYVTTTSNALDRGDLVGGIRAELGGITGNNIGFIGGGWKLGNPQNIMEYLDLDTTLGNSVDRGDITVGRALIGGV